MAVSERQFRMLADMCAEYEYRYGDDYQWMDDVGVPFDMPHIHDYVTTMLGIDPVAMCNHYTDELDEYMDGPIDGAQIPMLKDILGMFRGFLHMRGGRRWR